MQPATNPNTLESPVNLFLEPVLFIVGMISLVALLALI
jgi:hypothetical protein